MRPEEWSHREPTLAPHRGGHDPVRDSVWMNQTLITESIQLQEMNAGASTCVRRLITDEIEAGIFLDMLGLEVAS